MPVKEVFVVHDGVGVAGGNDVFVRGGEGQLPQPGLRVQPQVAPHHLVLLSAHVQGHPGVHLPTLGYRERIGNRV